MPEDQPMFGELYDAEGRLVADHQNLHPTELDHGNPLHRFYRRETDINELSNMNDANPAVLDYFLDAYLHWIGQGVDALRIDTVKHMPHAFWKRFAGGVRAEHPGMFIFGEHWDNDATAYAPNTWPENGGISVLDFAGKEAMRAVFGEQGESYARMRDYLHLTDGLYQNPYELMTFYDNHDMSRIYTQLGEDYDLYRMAIAYYATFSLVPTLLILIAVGSMVLGEETVREELFSNLNNTGEELVTHAATGIIEIGDPDMDEEVSLNADLSLNWQGERSYAELTLFYNTFSDYIFLLNTGTEIDETPVYVYEQDDADFYGVEFESSFDFASLAGGDLALGVFGDMTAGEFDSAGDVPRLPPMRIGSELSWRSDALGAYVRVLNADDQEDPGNFETETDGYTRWDAGIDYNVQFAGDTRLLAFVKWKNITDEEIRLSTSFLRNYAPQPGESIEAGVRLMF